MKTEFTGSVETQVFFLWKDGLGWYQGSTDEKGNNVDFLMKHCGVNNKSEAIRMLLDYAHITPSATIHNVPKEDNIPKELKLPPKADKYSHMYAYLINTRKIDKNIVYLFSKNKMLYEDNNNNVVFVGYDENNKACYGAVRRIDTKYKQQGYSVDKFLTENPELVIKAIRLKDPYYHLLDDVNRI